MGPYRYLALLGDPHFGIYSNSREWLRVMSDYFHLIVIPELLTRYPDAESRESVAVVLMGDLFNSKEHTDTVVRNTVANLLESITKYFDVLVLVGNHDTPLLTNIRVNSVREFRYMPRVQVFDVPNEVHLCSGATVSMQPWAHSRVELIDNLNGASDRARFCLAHNSVEGFHYQGKAVEGGKYPRLEHYERFNGGTYLGHIHKQQQIRNVRYIGSSYQTSFGEVGYACGYTIIDTDTGKFEFIENTFSPRYKTIPYLQLLGMPLSEATELVRNNYVRVLLPTRLPYALNPSKLNDVLTGYRLLETKTIAEVIKQDVGDRSEETPVDAPTLGNQADLGSKLGEFVDQMATYKTGKHVFPILNEQRVSVQSLVTELYAEAQQTLGSLGD